MSTVKTDRKRRGTPGYILAFLIVLFVLVHVVLDRLYGLRLHEALGYGNVYSKNMVFELCTRYLGAVIYAGLAFAALRPFKDVVQKVFQPLLFGVGIMLGWLIGYAMWSLNPTAWFLLFHHASFHHTDPVLHMDWSFYVYVLPTVEGFIGRLAGTLALFLFVRAACLVALFAKQQFVTRDKSLVQLMYHQSRMVLATLGALGVLASVFMVLHRYNIVLQSGNESFIMGPDYVTTHVTLPVFTWIGAIALLVFAVTCVWLSVRVGKVFTEQEGFIVFQPRGLKWPIGMAASFIGVSLLSSGVSAVVNGLYVHPNQNTVELPYIQNTIEATRFAMGIENVKAQPFQPQSTLAPAVLSSEVNVLKNVRINDQGQTTNIYGQLQSFKSYFTFDNTTVDRYNDSEVYVSARQLAADNLPVQTWVNKTLVYTHGYGLAISPVNQFDQNGLPVMWAKNTPQETVPPIPTITRPQIYFGTLGQDVLAPSKQPEFDYPQGSTDASSSYKGGYGLPVSGNRLLLAIEQGNLKFFTSDQITNQTQYLFDRNIYDRVQDIAPFLTYDHDAFPFVDASGHIKWMLDAYTETPNIPYAQSFMGTSYVRNSVKVVMDAYTGQTTFYVVDPSDAMVQSLMDVYPGLFQTEIPQDIRAHFRYPKDLFQAQAQALTKYHITDPSAFFNQEDVWAIANQIYNQNQVQPRPPVYQMVRMPDQTAPKFMVSELFTPTSKDNLNGWLVGSNEPDSYGQLTLYQFPQSMLIQGPMQAENQVDASPAISSQLTLWNQQGSHVVRGDLLLVPLGDTILYIEPVYLVADRENSLPQLERVIVDYNQKVYMNTTLAATLQDVFNGAEAGTSPPSGTGGTTGTGNSAGVTPPADKGTVQSLANKASQLLQAYQTDTAKGDFQAAGQDLLSLQDVLKQLQNQASSVAKPAGK